MDRDEALKLLRGGPEGVAEWNRRRNTGEEIPLLNKSDLSHANLCGVDFRDVYLAESQLFKADFRDASLKLAQFIRSDLREANFGNANLRHANLGETDLRGASLSGATLSHACYYWADLRDADLGGADLTEGLFGGAILSRVNLAGANLTKAIFQETIIADVDLSKVEGLDSVIHERPSYISIETFIRSQGRIPEPFLRGCGLPDAWIANLPALIGALEPIQFYSCFISYSHQDEEFARRLYSRARDEGLRVWYAPEHMKGGRKILDQLQGAIQVQDKLLLVLSEASMHSRWVETELRTALRREQRDGRQILFPIRISPWEPVRDWKCFDADSGRDLAEAVRAYHIPDFSQWKDHDAFEAAFARLLADLKADLAMPTSSA